ncbi:MAG: hypothetical protein ABEJ03_05865 [Candidatus Nanohaloarchaea archaeon]
MKAVCDCCQERQAELSCEVCGANVCRKDKLEKGCRVCNGGESTFG